MPSFHRGLLPQRSTPQVSDLQNLIIILPGSRSRKIGAGISSARSVNLPLRYPAGVRMANHPDRNPHQELAVMALS